MAVSIIPYVGGKYRMAEYLVEMLDYSKSSYAEVFGGGCRTLLNAPSFAKGEYYIEKSRCLCGLIEVLSNWDKALKFMDIIENLIITEGEFYRQKEIKVRHEGYIRWHLYKMTKKMLSKFDRELWGYDKELGNNFTRQFPNLLFNRIFGTEIEAMIEDIIERVRNSLKSEDFNVKDLMCYYRGIYDGRVGAVCYYCYDEMTWEPTFSLRFLFDDDNKLLEYLKKIPDDLCEGFAENPTPPLSLQSFCDSDNELLEFLKNIPNDLREKFIEHTEPEHNLQSFFKNGKKLLEFLKWVPDDFWERFVESTKPDFSLRSFFDSDKGLFKFLIEMPDDLREECVGNTEPAFSLRSFFDSDKALLEFLIKIPDDLREKFVENYDETGLSGFLFELGLCIKTFVYEDVLYEEGGEPEHIWIDEKVLMKSLEAVGGEFSKIKNMVNKGKIDDAKSFIKKTVLQEHMTRQTHELKKKVC